MKRNTEKKFNILHYSLLLFVIMAFIACNNYTISGTISITNNCDEKLESIPDTVKVSTTLWQNKNIGRPVNSIVVLTPVAGSITKTGNYEITVNAEGMSPTHWDTLKVTKLNGGDVCTLIPCENIKQHCLDMADKTSIITIDNTKKEDKNVSHPIRINCTCMNRLN